MWRLADEVHVHTGLTLHLKSCNVWFYKTVHYIFVSKSQSRSHSLSLIALQNIDLYCAPIVREDNTTKLEKYLSLFSFNLLFCQNITKLI